MTSAYNDGKLAELLAETPADAAARAAAAYDTRAGKAGRQVVLFGAGNLGRLVLAKLRMLGYAPLCFSDNDTSKWGTSVDGLRVIPPGEAAKAHGADAVALMTIWGGARERMAERVSALGKLGFARVVHCGFLFWKHPEAFLPYYAMDVPQKVLASADAVRAAYSVWSDEASRGEFVAQVRWRLTLDFDGLPPPVAHDVYFAPDLFSVRADERFVDCGAYDGDTLRVLLRLTNGMVGAVAAFEPDAISRARLNAWRESLPAGTRKRVVVRTEATGAAPGEVSFTSSGTPASAIGAGTELIPVVRLDDALADFRPTFIKMDIEGAELDTLVGARRTIADNRPILTVCTYHRQDDLWRIPLEISTSVRDYAFALRPHLLEVWELVTYAVPNERRRA